MQPRRLRLAAIQMVSENGQVTDNLNHASRWTRQAAREGAELVLLPELFSTGYDINAHAWGAAETQGGATESWLAATAAQHGFFIGGSYLERRGDDYFNTFALAGPAGIAGRVRKRHPCSVEAYIFKGSSDDFHVIATPLGRIGVAVCYDSCLREVWDGMLAGSPDLLLFPMSAPTPVKTMFYGERQIDAFHASFRDTATQGAQMVGMPCAMSNKWGPWQTSLPAMLPRLLLGQQRSSFPGFTHVADSNGSEVARITRGEGVAVATVCVDPSRKRLAVPTERDRFRPWIADVPREYRFFGMFESLGQQWYARARAPIGSIRTNEQATP